MVERFILKKTLIVLGIITIIAAVFFMCSKVQMHYKDDDTFPSIKFETADIEISVEDEKSMLLDGVTAYDEKDGDISASLIVENISNLLDDQTRLIQYVAFDNNNHIARAERKLHYKDYTPPCFYLKRPVSSVQLTDELADILDMIGAKDCIENDISGRIQILDSSFDMESLGNLNVTYQLQVTNSLGDIAEVAIPIKGSLSAEEPQKYSCSLDLSDYLIYTKTGSSPDLRQYITQVTAFSEDITSEILKKDGLKIDSSELNLNTPGSYIVTYQLTGEDIARLGSHNSGDKDRKRGDDGPDWEHYLDVYKIEDDEVLAEIQLVVVVEE